MFYASHTHMDMVIMKFSDSHIDSNTISFDKHVNKENF